MIHTLSQHQNKNISEQLHVVSVFAIVGLSITFIMACIALFNQNYLLASVLFIASSIYFVGYYIHKKHNKTALSSALVLYSLYALMFYLVYSGGASNTGPLWIFMVAPVSLFIHGLKRGLIDLIAFTFIITLIMFLPLELIQNTNYTIEFKLRLIYSFATVIFLSALYEYSRERSYTATLELTKKYQELANFDSLTHLSNRRNATLILAQEHARAVRNNEPLTIMMCDVDHFKQVNDEFGHHGGDAALIALSELFTQRVREQDNVSRWGGEEFLFILPQTNNENAHVIAEKIRQDVENLLIKSFEHNIQVTVSIGIAEFKKDHDIDETISHADKQLYIAKNSGRNKISSDLSH